ncbi:MAG: hypothetical protein LBU16_09795 [Treponema sp.]|jgi:hypothetical protein|nr:hypothetical protein [Treponema sp.]
MSKYTEYREIAGKMETVFKAEIGGSAVSPGKVRIVFMPISDNLNIEIPGIYRNEFTITGATGEALLRALRQIYE